MQFLPLLSIESLRGQLPLSIRSAAVLGRALVDEDRQSTAGLLAEAIRIDPPLAVWAFFRARQDGIEPCDVNLLAAWLAQRAGEVLRWHGRSEAVDAATTDEAKPIEQFVRRVKRALVLAEVAATLAADEPDATQDAIRLAALLHDWGAWFEGNASDRSELAPLPLSKTAVDWVNRAVVWIDQHKDGPGGEERFNVAVRQAAETAELWAKPSEVPAIPLTQLSAKMGRLRDLDVRFHETVEAEKLEAMAEFAAGAGHEINNPLAVIAGRAQLLLQEEHDPERRRTLALINTQAKRVFEMIADMMLFARPPEPAKGQVELVGLVDRVIEELGTRAADQDISLERIGEDRPIVIQADPTQLSVALRAMCQNSIEAIGRDGHIEFSLDSDEKDAVIRIADNGPGISEAARRHLFDPYYSERQAGRGLGLGLSKCWRIVVTNHGGQIDVDSRPGNQTTFTIRLPKE